MIEVAPESTAISGSPTPRYTTPPDSNPVKTNKDESCRPLIPNYPIFDKNDDAVPKGLLYFSTKKVNVVNFDPDTNATWRHSYRGSEVLCWNNDQKHTGSVNLFIIGRIGKANFMAAESAYNEPAYRLELVLERNTMLALRKILNNGPLKDLDHVKYPLIGRTAIFSAKFKTLIKDVPNLDVSDPFPFLFDGRCMSQKANNVLKYYPAKQLSDIDLLAVETNISSYDIPAMGESLGRIGYSLSLREVYVVTGDSMTDSTSNRSSPSSLKRHGDNLVSPRKNKKAGQLAVFSDED